MGITCVEGEEMFTRLSFAVLILKRTSHSVYSNLGIKLQLIVKRDIPSGARA